MKYRILICAALLTPVIALAETESLQTFKAGDRVKAAEMNANFSTLEARIDTLKQSVTFDGLDDIYSGTAETEAGSETSESLVQEGVYGAQLGTLNAAASTNNTPCTEDTGCVINGNRATVTCNGEQGKLASLLKSEDAKAAFLIVEVIGNCVEDQLLVTRGAAFFSKNNGG